jgi:hypothetical protein
VAIYDETHTRWFPLREFAGKNPEFNGKIMERSVGNHELHRKFALSGLFRGAKGMQNWKKWFTAELTPPLSGKSFRFVELQKFYDQTHEFHHKPGMSFSGSLSWQPPMFQQDNKKKPYPVIWSGLWNHWWWQPCL